MMLKDFSVPFFFCEAHSPHHLGISTEADRADHASFLVCVKHDCICVGRQPDLRRRIIIPQLDQLAL